MNKILTACYELNNEILVIKHVSVMSTAKINNLQRSNLNNKA